MKDTQELGNEIRKLRLDRGWRQSDLASESGIGQSTISMIERGLFSPTLNTIQKIAEGLGCRLEVNFPEEE